MSDHCLNIAASSPHLVLKQRLEEMTVKSDAEASATTASISTASNSQSSASLANGTSSATDTTDCGRAASADAEHLKLLWPPPQRVTLHPGETDIPFTVTATVSYTSSSSHPIFPLYYRPTVFSAFSAQSNFSFSHFLIIHLYTTST